MAKDPAFLFYSNDFLAGTYTMTDEQVGKYIRLLCLQHQKIRLTETEFNRLCNNDIDIIVKFKKETINGTKYFYNEKLRIEADRRNKYTESRRSNRNKSDNENVSIYFIKNIQKGYIKIGSSVNPKRRFIELNKDNNLEFLFCTEKTGQKLESLFHDKYKEFRVFNEWYDIDNCVETIKKVLNDMNIHIIYDMETETETETINKTKDEDKDKDKVNFSFEYFWNLYDKKVGNKDKIGVKWNKLSNEERVLAIEHIPKYKESQPDKQFRKNPETYLNNKSFNDEIINSNGIKKTNTRGINKDYTSEGIGKTY